MNAQDLQIKFDQLLSITKDSYDTFLSQTEIGLRAARPLILAVEEDAADPAALTLDMALVAAAPVAAVPRHCEFAPLAESGHRFLLAEGGLYVEVRRPWLHFIHRIASPTGVHVPYGVIEEKVQLEFGALGTALAQLKEFGAYAQAESPIESAASVIWNSVRRDWAIKYPKVIGEATPTRIQFEQVDLEDDDNLVMDLHSHGTGPAYFSSQDNADDEGSVKIAGVFGNLDLALPTVEFRLCVLGLYLPIPVPAEKIFG